MLIDLTGLPLDRLIGDGGTALTDALRQLVADLDADPECLSAFDNYAGEPGAGGAR